MFTTIYMLTAVLFLQVRASGECIRFGAVINEKKLIRNIFSDKRSKQRFLDYAYKISLKNAFQQMANDSLMRFEDVRNVNLFIDEHTTATNGLYELREGLLQEFKFGTYNYSYSRFFPPIFPVLQSVDVRYCNSSSVALVRAADVIANRIYYLSLNDKPMDEQRYLYIKEFP